MRSIITLTTDFGLADGFVGAMKGVILNIAPQVHIVDISHQIPRHCIKAGAWVLWGAQEHFPDGSIHIGVVDPGVILRDRGSCADAGQDQFGPAAIACKVVRVGGADADDQCGLGD